MEDLICDLADDEIYLDYPIFYTSAIKGNLYINIDDINDNK